MLESEYCPRSDFSGGGGSLHHGRRSVVGPSQVQVRVVPSNEPRDQRRFTGEAACFREGSGLPKGPHRVPLAGLRGREFRGSQNRQRPVRLRAAEGAERGGVFPGRSGSGSVKALGRGRGAGLVIARGQCLWECAVRSPTAPPEFLQLQPPVAVPGPGWSGELRHFPLLGR